MVLFADVIVKDYLDTSAISDLWQKDYGAHVIERLKTPGLRAVILSETGLLELAGNNDLYLVAKLGTLLQIRGLRVLKVPRALRDMELDVALYGDRPFPFMERDEAEDLFATALARDPDKIRSLVRSRQDLHAEIDANLRAELSDQNPEGVQKDAQNWAKSEHVDDFVRRHVAESDFYPSQLPDVWDPRDLKTLWGYMAFHLGRMSVLGQQGKLNKLVLSPRERAFQINDGLDNHHYSSAMYADRLVTSDETFATYARSAPPPGPVVLTTRDWAAEILAT